MAEGFLKAYNNQHEIFSAGTMPADEVHPMAIQVMQEVEVDISGGIPKHVNQYINDSFDYVITVCDDARESCPVFLGEVKKRIHIGFEDPAKATGTEEKVLNEFRSIRDQIQKMFYNFYLDNIK
jgi:arsenate reductase